VPHVSFKEEINFFYKNIEIDLPLKKIAGQKILIEYCKKSLEQNFQQLISKCLHVQNQEQFAKIIKIWFPFPVELS
jgi:hypothetical protein